MKPDKKKAPVGKINTRWVMENYPQWIQDQNEALYQSKMTLMQCETALAKVVELLEKARPQMKMEYVNE